MSRWLQGILFGVFAAGCGNASPSDPAEALPGLDPVAPSGLAGMGGDLLPPVGAPSDAVASRPDERALVRDSTRPEPEGVDAHEAALPAAVGSSQAVVDAGAPVRLPLVEMEPGAERTLCQSVALDNDETLYVERIEAELGPGVHHGLFYFVPPSEVPEGFGGPDNACVGYDALRFIAVGGLLYASSTLGRSDEQAFPPGRALAIPPGSIIVSQSHLLNVTQDVVSTDVALMLHTVEPETVERELHLLYMEYFPLALPPGARSSFSTVCDFRAKALEVLGSELDFSIYFLMGHYHSYADGLRVEVEGGGGAGTPVYEVDASVGEALGRSVDPAVSLAGATGLRLTCTYTNATASTVTFQEGLAQGEMCAFISYTDAAAHWFGRVARSAENTYVGTVDDVLAYEGPCDVESPVVEP